MVQFSKHFKIVWAIYRHLTFKFFSKSVNKKIVARSKSLKM